MTNDGTVPAQEPRQRRKYERRAPYVDPDAKRKRIEAALCKQFSIPNFDADATAEFHPAFAAIKDYAIAYIVRDKFVRAMRSIKDPEEYEAKATQAVKMITAAWERLIRTMKEWKSALNDDSGKSRAANGSLADAVRRQQPG